MALGSPCCRLGRLLVAFWCLEGSPEAQQYKKKPRFPFYVLTGLCRGLFCSAGAVLSRGRPKIRGFLPGSLLGSPFGAILAAFGLPWGAFGGLWMALWGPLGAVCVSRVPLGAPRWPSGSLVCASWGALLSSGVSLGGSLVSRGLVRSPAV